MKTKIIFIVFLAFLEFSSCQVTQMPWEPFENSRDLWQYRHWLCAQDAINRGNKIQVIFYGDSITEGWFYGGAGVWNASYALYEGANYGIAGDIMQNVLWRVENGNLEYMTAAKLIVLEVGGNNLWYPNNDDLVLGIKTIVSSLRELVPTAKVLLLGLFPLTENGWFQKLIDLNIKLSKLKDNQNVFFLDMKNDFARGWELLEDQLYNPDTVHLSEAGYNQWEFSMREIFNKLMNIE